MEFSYGTKKWKSKGVYVTPKEEDESASGSTVEFALGLHAPGRFDKIMPIHNCLLQHDVSNQVGYCVLCFVCRLLVTINGLLQFTTILYRKFDELEKCLVCWQVLKLVQEYGERNVEEMPPYNVRTHEGYLKHLTIRSGR